MSSSYYILCLNHDPAIALDMSYGSADESIKAVKERGDDSPYELLAHKNCDLVISRHSGAPWQIYDPQYEDWTHVEWLRMFLKLIQVQGAEQASTFYKLPGKWTVERVLKLRNELDDGEGDEFAHGKFAKKLGDPTKVWAYSPIPMPKTVVAPEELCTHPQTAGKCSYTNCPNYKHKPLGDPTPYLQPANGQINQMMTVPMPDSGYVRLLVRPDTKTFTVYGYKPGEDLDSAQHNRMDVPPEVAWTFVLMMMDVLGWPTRLSDFREAVLSFNVRVPDNGFGDPEPGSTIILHPSDVEVVLQTGTRLIAERG